MLSEYIRSCPKNKFLTKEEEAIASPQELVERNLRLVIAYVIKKCKDYSIRDNNVVMDIIQEGNLGLIRATKTFRPEKGYRFTTYARWWIRLYVGQAFGKLRLINIPSCSIQHIQDYCNLKEKLEADGQSYDNEEIRIKLGWTKKRLRRILKALQPISSINTTTTKKTKDLDIAISDRNILEESEEIAIIEKLLENDDPRILYIISSRFLESGDKKSLEEIGHELGITKERTRQLQKDGLRIIERRWKLK